MSPIRRDPWTPRGPLTKEGLKRLEHLSLNGMRQRFESLTVLEHATNLTKLRLESTEISDISPLASLTNLTDLDLEANQVSNVSPLAPLTNLKMLDLFGNQVKDISPLASLTNLTWLCLSGNVVGDISPLASLTSLTELWLGHNQPDQALARAQHQNSDVSSLTALTNLYVGYIENRTRSSGRTLADFERRSGKAFANSGTKLVH